MRTETKYITDDGMVFNNPDVAIKWEMKGIIYDKVSCATTGIAGGYARDLYSCLLATNQDLAAKFSDWVIKTLE